MYCAIYRAVPFSVLCLEVLLLDLGLLIVPGRSPTLSFASCLLSELCCHVHAFLLALPTLWFTTCLQARHVSVCLYK